MTGKEERLKAEKAERKSAILLANPGGKKAEPTKGTASPPRKKTWIFGSGESRNLKRRREKYFG